MPPAPRLSADAAVFHTFAPEPPPSHPPTLRQQVHHVLHSRPAKVVLLALLLVDLGLVIASVLLETGSLHIALDECERTVHQCEAAPSRVRSSAASPLFSSKRPRPACRFEHPPLAVALHTAERVLSYVSMGVLAFFLLERLVGAACEGLAFFRDGFQVFDLSVIVISLVLEVLFLGQPGVGLFAIGRFWRFVRIGHGFHEAEEFIHPVDEFLRRNRAELVRLYEQMALSPDLLDLDGQVRADDTGAVDEALKRLQNTGCGGLLLGVAAAAVTGSEQRLAALSLRQWRLQ